MSTLKRKRADDQGAQGDKKRPDQPKNVRKVNYLGGYVVELTKAKKWKAFLPAATPGGPFERTRQFKDPKTKAAQFKAALDVLEQRVHDASK